MKERGIVFTGPSIPALLSGAKTQTRRLMQRQPPAGESTWGNDCGRASCHAGDLIWVREAWRTFRNYDHLKPSALVSIIGDHHGQYIHYLADPPVELARRGITISGRYRNARFLPKAFARIWLKVLDVRPERLQDISEEDAKAEGFPSDGRTGLRYQSDKGMAHLSTARSRFIATWNLLHKPPNAWADNRWVWRYRVERTESPS